VSHWTAEGDLLVESIWDDGASIWDGALTVWDLLWLAEAEIGH
jgi:hypothetical protein